MTQDLLKQKSIKLRMQGYSYNLISKKLKVSKSTLSDWLSNISYTPNDEVMQRIGRAHAFAGKRMALKKSASIEQAHALAQKDIGMLTKRDLFMLGIGLYIGEGAKSNTMIRVSNADPAIISLAIQWLKDVCDLKNDNFSIRLHIYPNNDIVACVRHWSRLTGIPPNQFRKTYIDRRMNKKIGKRGKLPYGTAHLSVLSRGNILHGAFLRRRINGWMECVLKGKANN